MITLASLALSPVIYLVIAYGLIGLGFSFWNYKKLSKNNVENDKTELASSNITKGVKILSNSRLILLALLSVLIGLSLYFFYGSSKNIITLISFMLGAVSSFAAYYTSQYIAADTGEILANETAKSYKKGFRKAFDSSISSSVVNVSVFILGISLNMLVINLFGIEFNKAFIPFICFAFGVGIVSVFNRLSGDIFQQSAAIAENELIQKHDKVTAKSLFNPSAVLKSVGRLTSNVGGISSDVFDTLSIASIAAILFGARMVSPEFAKTEMLVYFPVFLIGMGILTSILASFFLNSGKPSNSKIAMKFAEGVSSAVLLLSAFFAIKFALPAEWTASRTTDTETIVTTYYSLGIFWSVLIGVLSSVGLGYINDSFSDYKRQVSKEIAGQSMKGAVSNNLSTMQISFISTGIPVLILVAVGLTSYYLANFYGLAITAVSFLGNIALQQSFGAFAAVTETSENIATKSYLDKETLNNANLMKKEGHAALSNLQMFLLVAASLSVLSVFSNFLESARLFNINVANPFIMGVLTVGGLIPVLLSYNTLGAVKRVKKKVIREVEKQFNQNMSLQEADSILLKYDGNLTFATEGEKETVYRAKVSVDNNKCVREAANISFYEVLIHILMLMVVIVMQGFSRNHEIIASFLVGFTLSSVILAAYSIIKGTLSESAKNTAETGFIYNGEIIEKSTKAYEVALSSDRSNKALKEVVAPTAIMLVKIVIIASMMLLPLLNSAH